MTKVLATVLGVLGLIVTLGQGCSKSGFKAATLNLSSTSSAPVQATCDTPPGFSGTPQTIEEAIAMINVLPRPVTAACFLQSLKRPLGVTLTNSTTSMQPAFNTRSPRIFVLVGNLTISVVPEGDGSEVIEFSVLTSTATTLKGELALPVTAPLAKSAAYDRIRFGDSGTTCQFCHSNEVRDPNITWANAFRSDAFLPRAATKVDLEFLRNEWATCDAVAEPKRCETLKGLFGYGEVDAKDFPADYKTFGGF
jgi:hypothetical protein